MQGKHWLADFAWGLFVGVLIWLLIGALISGATWRLYDISWAMIVVPILAIFTFGWWLLDAVRSR